jgi:hypothetical protein
VAVIDDESAPKEAAHVDGSRQAGGAAADDDAVPGVVLHEPAVA